MTNRPKDEIPRPLKSNPMSEIMMGLLLVIWVIAFGFAVYSNAIH